MASSTDVRQGEDYKTYFDGKTYASTLFETAIEQPDFSKLIRFRLDTLHKIYSTGHLNGKLLLEIGSGPCIHTVIPAAKWFDEIIMTDYTPSNREMLKKWLEKDPDATNWNSYFKYYSKLQGNESTCQEIEDDLRRKIKQVLPCNVHLPNPLDPVKLDLADAICSSACLESASSNMLEYTQAMKNVASLLKQGGLFILFAFLNCTHYPVGNERFKCLPTTKDQVLNTLKTAGLDIIECFDDDSFCNEDFAPYNGTVLILSEKK